MRIKLFEKRKRRKEIERAIGIHLKYDCSSIFFKFHHRRMKRRALKQWEITGKQQHVMPVGNEFQVRNNSFKSVVIIDNSIRKTYNKAYRKNKTNINQLLHMALFSTPAGNRLIS